MAALSYTPVSNKPAAQAEKVEAILNHFMQKRSRRYNFEAQWQESALIYLPEWANKFFFGSDEWPGTKKSQYQIEAYPSIAAHRFMAICNSLITPWTMNWSPLQATGKNAPYLMKQQGVRQYFADAGKVLWSERYKGCSGFLGAQLINWLSLGVFGNQNMFVEELRDYEGPGLSYRSCPVGEVYYDVNHQGRVGGFFRAFKWNAKQIHERWPDTFPPELRPALEQKSGQLYWIIQYCYPNDEYYPAAIASPRGKRFSSCYVSMTGHSILEEGGYRTFPMAAGRYIVAPDEDYGRGPGQIVLGGAKSMQAMKAAFLKQTHRKGDPTLLGPDGGLVNTDFRPGDFVEGGMNDQGQPLIGVLPTGDIEDIEKAMAREQAMIDDSFLVSLFDLALKTEEQPQLNVRQVMELLEQRGMLLGPTIGRQLGEYLDPLVERELDILNYIGKLPPMPGVLREAEGEFETAWDNPLTRMLAASDAAAFMQAVEMAAQVSNALGGDRSVFHSFAFKRAIPGISLSLGAREDWMATAAEIKQAEKAEAQQAEREARAKELPAQAAMAKAQAIVQKAQSGGNIGGTLSGTAPGGMPQVPGNPPGLPGRPGVGGRPGLSGRPGR